MQNRYIKCYQYMLPVRVLRKRMGWSERHVAELSSLSRATVRKIETNGSNTSFESVGTLVQKCFEKEVSVVFHGRDCESDCSTVGVSYKILRDGDHSWKIHLMDLVDAFRRSLDCRIILLPPPHTLNKKCQALIASTVSALCEEAQIESPNWCRKSYFLESPWFVSGVQSLKAAALLESPIPFRLNNIFVHENFLARI